MKSAVRNRIFRVHLADTSDGREHIDVEGAAVEINDHGHATVQYGEKASGVHPYTDFYGMAVFPAGTFLYIEPLVTDSD